MTRMERIERADTLFSLLGALPGEDFDHAPLCEDPQATTAEREQLAELFFPVSEDDTERIEAAKALCARCPVRASCLQFALRLGEDHGIWGGLTAGERRRTRLAGSGEHGSEEVRAA